jgi:hypothetical protein
MKNCFLLSISILLLASCNTSSREKVLLAEKIRQDTTFPVVKREALDLIGSGFNAGAGYGEVWIRDFNTFMNLACDMMPGEQIREKLIVFFQFQGADGNVVDAYIPVEQQHPGSYRYIFSELRPDLAAHKNTVETDQESSLVQAVAKYVRKTGDRGFLATEIDGVPVSVRMEKALEYLLTYRFSKEYGLIYGGTTADWGDVQPEHEWGVFITGDTHYAIDIYDNAMLVIAIRELIGMIPGKASEWEPVMVELKKNIRRHLWDPERMKFRPHIYLNGSPFPEDFNEDEIYYQGGTAVAIEADLLSREEVRISFLKMIGNVKNAGASTIGLTLYPAYPEGYFKNPILSKPYTYQNGGDWTWFGGRMIQQLVRYGFVKEAYEQILPMTQRVIKNNGFYEWYSLDNEPRGSAAYRGSAGVLYDAVVLLEKWAAAHSRDHKSRNNVKQDATGTME